MPSEPISYYNKRAEMWGSLREWLAFGSIDDDADLQIDLTAPRYAYKLLDGRDAILLESKDDMRTRGLASPDDGDALALTFAYPVQKSTYAGGPHRTGQPMVQVDYDPFADQQPQQNYGQDNDRRYPTSYDAILNQRVGR